MNVPELKSIFDAYGLHPNKRLGQNFLVVRDMRDRIIEAVAPSPEDRVLEIGPGLGALTGELIRRAARVTAVEIDSGLSRYLSERFASHENFRLFHDDFLRHQPEGPFTKVVSNLPYYCSTEILFGVSRYEAPLVFVMVQKELADRIAASPGDGNYGALSVTLGFYYEPKVLFKVNRESFYPRPEVASSFIRLTRRASFRLEGDDVSLFHALVKSAFWGRRKTILKALSDSPHLGGGGGDARHLGRQGAARVLAAAGIDGTRRGEELGRDEYIALVRAYREVMPGAG